jgi:hypothetical protein
MVVPQPDEPDAAGLLAPDTAHRVIDENIRFVDGIENHDIPMPALEFDQRRRRPGSVQMSRLAAQVQRLVQVHKRWGERIASRGELWHEST